MSNEIALDHDELRDLIADVLDVEPDAVTDHADFVADLGVDSLLALELAVTLERHYKIKIESNEIVDVRTMDDVITLMSTKFSAE